MTIMVIIMIIDIIIKMMTAMTMSRFDLMKSWVDPVEPHQNASFNTNLSRIQNSPIGVCSKYLNCISIEKMKIIPDRKESLESSRGSS